MFARVPLLLHATQARTPTGSGAGAPRRAGKPPFAKKTKSPAEQVPHPDDRKPGAPTGHPAGLTGMKKEAQSNARKIRKQSGLEVSPQPGKPAAISRFLAQGECRDILEEWVANRNEGLGEADSLPNLSDACRKEWAEAASKEQQSRGRRGNNRKPVTATDTDATGRIDSIRLLPNSCLREFERAREQLRYSVDLAVLADSISESCRESYAAVHAKYGKKGLSRNEFTGVNAHLDAGCRAEALEFVGKQRESLSPTCAAQWELAQDLHLHVLMGDAGHDHSGLYDRVRGMVTQKCQRELDTALQQYKLKPGSRQPPRILSPQCQFEFRRAMDDPSNERGAEL